MNKPRDFEVWEYRTNNLLGVYTTATEAFTVTDAIIQTYGPLGHDLEVISQRTGNPAHRRRRPGTDLNCSKCGEHKPNDMCPQRPWCRSCENTRRRKAYHAAKSVRPDVI